MVLPFNSRRVVRKSRKCRRAAGFTIAEIALSGTILVFALCSCFGVIQQSFKTLDFARSSTLAAQIMQSEIERLRLLSWDKISALTTSTADIDISTMYSADAGMANRFHATRTVSPIAGRDMVDIQISVTWTAVGGKTFTRTFKTKYTKKGLYDYLYSSRSST